MKTTQSIAIYSTINVAGKEFQVELSETPSNIMDYHEAFVAASPDSNLVVVGYLIDDEYCSNPLEDCDGEGHIYTARRHAPPEELRGFQKAMGLDSDWQSIVNEDEVLARYQAYFVAHMPLNEKLLNITEREANETDVAYLQRCAQVDFEYGKNHSTTVAFPTALTNIYAAVHNEARDTLAVPMDVYEHSGIQYSVSGEGMQDQFDTARNGAIWVPDDTARENIQYTALQSLLPAGVRVEYCSTDKKQNDITYFLPDGTKQGGFPHFTAAILGAAAALGIKPDAEALAAAEQAEARKYAKSVAKVYSSWCNGETYGYVIDQYECDGEKLTLTNSNNCSGYIGDESALAEMCQAGQSHLDFLLNQPGSSFP